jgi:hypothetical protein
MDIQTAKEILRKSNGNHLYEIFIPSIEKTLLFKPLLTGQQKSLTKFSMNSDTFNYEYEMIKISLFDELLADNNDIDIKGNDLTEIDMVAFLAGVRMNNVLEPFEIICTCGDCRNEFNYEIKLYEIIENCKKAHKTQQFEYKIELDDVKYEFELGIPSYKDLVDIEFLVSVYKNQLNKNEDELKNFRIFTKPCAFIKTLKINDSKIDMNTFAEKYEMYNSLPPIITINGKKSILNIIIENFNLIDISDVINTIVCPECDKKLEGVITNDSFFII